MRLPSGGRFNREAVITVPPTGWRNRPTAVQSALAQ